MVPTPHPVQEVVREANRRRLLRVAVAYPAAAFAVLEATHLIGPVLGAPEWVSRVVMGAAVLGFPIAMVLTWDYDITSHGVVRTPADAPTETLPLPPRWRWLAFTLGCLAVAAVLRGLR